MGENPRGSELEPAHLDWLKRVVEEEPNKSWSIVLAQFDPDGASTALLTKAALEKLGVEAEIFYAGTIGHPQNRALFNVFELEKTFSPISKLPESGPIALVDSSKFVDKRFGREIDCARFKIVIDHHLGSQAGGKNNKDRFVWIVSTGAAATLAYRLVKALDAPIDKDLATIGAIGIHADTDRFRSVHTTAADRRAFVELMEIGDQDRFSTCSVYPLSNRYFDLMEQVLENREEIDAFVMSHPSTLMRGSEGDNLSLFADLLHRDPSHHTAIVWAVIGDHVRVSVRSRSQDSLEELIDELFGPGTGGGKHGSGGATIKLLQPCIPTHETAEKFITWFAASLAEKVQAHVGAQKKDDED